MNRGTLGVGIMLAGTILISPPADGAQIDLPNLVVRVYMTSPVGNRAWTATIRDATTILDDAGVAVGWINCSEVATDGGLRCAQPLKSNEVAVRIVRAQPSPPRRELPLGESLLDPVHHIGTLATIYIDRVEWLARASGIERETVLARAIVHEIGHLLLGTTAHSRRGLMRPIWSRDELVRGRVADWLFPAEDATRLQQALARRLVPAPESVVAWSTD